MTNYDQLRAKYLSKPENRKLYEIEMTKLEFIETIERLTKATSATQSSFPTIRGFGESAHPYLEYWLAK